MGESRNALMACSRLFIFLSFNFLSGDAMMDLSRSYSLFSHVFF